MRQLRFCAAHLSGAADEMPSAKTGTREEDEENWGEAR